MVSVEKDLSAEVSVRVVRKLEEEIERTIGGRESGLN